MASDLRSSSRRILMLCTDRRIDRRISLQADSLEEDGWQVTILAMPLDQPTPETDPRVVRLGAAGMQARREGRVLAIYRVVRRHLPMNGRLMRLLKSFAWRFLVDQERFYLNLFLADGRRHPAEIVVAHDLPMLAVGRVLAEKFGARLVYDSHELYSEQEFSPAQRAAWAKIERRHIHACDRVITVNPSIAKELQTRYGLAEVEVILNAERVGQLPPRSTYLHSHFGIPEAHRILLFQGGLSATRNLVELVEAMARLSDRTLHLVLLGDGQLWHNLQRLVGQRGLQEQVHLHPAVAQAELLAVTAAADAGVIPYQGICLNNYYCTPNKLFEFVAAGLPILASDLPELRRLVEDQQIGRVADLSTPAAIATAIADFFADEQRLLRWRDNLLEVRRELSWEREGERLKRIYGTLR